MSFFQKMLSGGKPPSSQVAKERLQLVLVHDRSNLSPAQVAAMKDEILAVIARYVDFDPDEVELDLTSDDRQNMLHAEIPLKATSAGRRRHAANTISSDLGDA
jgi:cell division topological specificity factor